MTGYATTDESVIANELREARRQEAAETREDALASLRERQAAKRMAKAAAKAKKAESRRMSGLSVATGGLLRWAWLTIIPSWGLSIIYINIHVFMRFVVGPKIFCKLGDEWVPKQLKAQTAGRTIGIVEVMALAILDVMIFFLILALITVITFIASILSSTLNFITAIVSAIWSNLTSFLSSGF